VRTSGCCMAPTSVRAVGATAEVVGTWAQGQGREVQREVVVSDGTDADAGGVSAAGADGWGCAGMQATANCELGSSFFAIAGAAHTEASAAVVAFSTSRRHPHTGAPSCVLTMFSTSRMVLRHRRPLW